MSQKKIVIVGSGNAALSAGIAALEKGAEVTIYEKADKNGDGIVTKHELSKKVFSALAWYEKIPFNIFGGIDRIMKDCDANRNGQLTVEESLNMKNCMDSCFKRRHTKEKFRC